MKRFKAAYLELEDLNDLKNNSMKMSSSSNNSKSSSSFTPPIFRHSLLFDAQWMLVSIHKNSRVREKSFTPNICA
jgi:hypothetical protein